MQSQTAQEQAAHNTYIQQLRGENDWSEKKGDLGYWCDLSSGNFQVTDFLVNQPFILLQRKLPRLKCEEADDDDLT